MERTPLDHTYHTLCLLARRTQGRGGAKLRRGHNRARKRPSSPPIHLLRGRGLFSEVRPAPSATVAASAGLAVTFLPACSSLPCSAPCCWVPPAIFHIQASQDIVAARTGKKDESSPSIYLPFPFHSPLTSRTAGHPAIAVVLHRLAESVNSKDCPPSCATTAGFSGTTSPTALALRLYHVAAVIRRKAAVPHFPSLPSSSSCNLFRVPFFFPMRMGVFLLLRFGCLPPIASASSPGQRRRLALCHVGFADDPDAP